MRLKQEERVLLAEEICRHVKDLAEELESAVEDLYSLDELFDLAKAEDTLASVDWIRDRIDAFKEHTNHPMGALLDDDIIDG